MGVTAMKRAVITTGGKQYLVSEGETLAVELLHKVGKTVEFEPLMIIDNEKINIGTPVVEKVTVTAEVINQDVQADKVMAIRYKAKKRVHKIRGHRQHHS